MKLNSQNKIIEELSERYGISKKEVIEIVTSPFKFIRNETKKIEFTGDETEEEFNEKIKNFNIPSIGKLYGSYYNFKYINNGRSKKSKKGKSK